MTFENELRNTKNKYNKLLGVLARTVSRKFNIEGYSTDYMMDADGVQVIFQKIGMHESEKYNVEFNEIERADYYELIGCD